MLDESELNMNYDSSEYENYYLELNERILESVELQQEYEKWAMENRLQLLGMYCKRLYEDEWRAVTNTIGEWAMFIYTIWHMHNHDKTQISSEIDDLINNL